MASGDDTVSLLPHPVLKSSQEEEGGCFSLSVSSTLS